MSKQGSPAEEKSESAAEAKREGDAPRKMKLGSGGRFAALKAALAKRSGVDDPGALAASIGRKKYGAKKFNSLSK